MGLGRLVGTENRAKRGQDRPREPQKETKRAHDSLRETQRETKREKIAKTDTQTKPRKTKWSDQRAHTRERSKKESQERPKPKRDRRLRQKVNTTLSRREPQGKSQRPKRRKIEAQSWQHGCLQSFFYLRSVGFPSAGGRERRET